MTPCMGGNCTCRDRCARHIEPGNFKDPSERLCGQKEIPILIAGIEPPQAQSEEENSASLSSRGVATACGRVTSF